MKSGPANSANAQRNRPRALQRQAETAAVLVDCLCAAAAVAAAYWTRARIGPPWLPELRHPFDVYLGAMPWVCLLWLVTAYHSSLYRVPLASLGLQIGKLARGTSLAALVLAAASFLSHFDYSRAMLLMFWGYLTVFEMVGRGLVATAVARAAARCGPVRAVIVGTGDLARIVAEKLARAHLPGYECLGFVAADGDAAGDVVGQLRELPQIVRAYHVEEVFVASPSADADAVLEAVDRCEDEPVTFFLVAGPLQALAGPGIVAELSELPVIELPGRRSPGLGYMVAKRAMDIIAAAVLLLLFSPLLLVIAWLIRRETGASALFVQERVGYRGRLFKMYKFRTMRPDAHPYAEAPRDPYDPRVTPTGRWLRRYSLDELPQLLNVIKGDMSLVGPRPEMPFIVERYKPWQRRRLEAKPGITGLWQIMGRKDIPLVDNIEYDFYYLRHQSLLLDIEILLRTIPAVLSGRGAY
ncbi:MAG: sugar transferase [Armatimonadetes bacterium]|nr:sugar transferase [Armatimonadota bacterium]